MGYNWIFCIFVYSFHLILLHFSTNFTVTIYILCFFQQWMNKWMNKHRHFVELNCRPRWLSRQNRQNKTKRVWVEGWTATKYDNFHKLPNRFRQIFGIVYMFMNERETSVKIETIRMNMSISTEFVSVLLFSCSSRGQRQNNLSLYFAFRRVWIQTQFYCIGYRKKTSLHGCSELAE